MNVFTPVGIILFSMFIMFFLQLIPGVFALFYHSLAGKFSKFKTDHIALFFIFGVETGIALLFFLIYSIINSSTYVYDFLTGEIMRWLLAGLLIALAFAFFFAYFRPLKTAKSLKNLKTRKSQKSTTTELFISHSFKAKYLAKIAKANTRSDAFLLGFTAIIPELIFTLPLLLISTLAIITLGTTVINRALLILLFIFATILPLLILYVYFSRGNTLADFIRFRFKNKSFARFFITFLYFLLALLIILEITL